MPPAGAAVLVAGLRTGAAPWWTLHAQAGPGHQRDSAAPAGMFGGGAVAAAAAEDAMVHQIATIFADYVQSRGAKAGADAAYIRSHLEVLGLDKMCQALEQKYGEAPREAIGSAFALFDGDGDGSITADELMHMLSTVENGLEEADVIALMEKADLDGDGKIDEDEFYQLLMGKPPDTESVAAPQQLQQLQQATVPVPVPVPQRPKALAALAANVRPTEAAAGEGAEEGAEGKGAEGGSRAAAPVVVRRRTPPRPSTPPERDDAPLPPGGRLTELAQASVDAGGSTTEEEEDEPQTLQDRVDDGPPTALPFAVQGH